MRFRLIVCTKTKENTDRNGDFPVESCTPQIFAKEPGARSPLSLLITQKKWSPGARIFLSWSSKPRSFRPSLKP